MGLIKILLVFVIIYYIVRWLVPKLLGLWVIKKQRQFSEQFGQSRGTYSYGNHPNSGSTSRKREGEIRVEQTQHADKKKVARNVGDYVEYEEVVEKDYEKSVN